jgi:hypothetical protein
MGLVRDCGAIFVTGRGGMAVVVCRHVRSAHHGGSSREKHGRETRGHGTGLRFMPASTRFEAAAPDHVQPYDRAPF